jgi:hypothetical protein
MRPHRSILDTSFRYVPAVATSVASTSRRFGWRPTTEGERRARRLATMELVVDFVGTVEPRFLKDPACSSLRGTGVSSGHAPEAGT